VLLGQAKILHVIEALPGAEQAADGDDQDVNQIVVFAQIHARVGERLKMFDQAGRWMFSHRQLVPYSLEKSAPKIKKSSRTLNASALPGLASEVYSAAGNCYQ